MTLVMILAMMAVSWMMIQFKIYSMMILDQMIPSMRMMELRISSVMKYAMMNLRIKTPLLQALPLDLVMRRGWRKLKGEG